MTKFHFSKPFSFTHWSKGVQVVVEGQKNCEEVVAVANDDPCKGEEADAMDTVNLATSRSFLGVQQMFSIGVSTKTHSQTGKN